MSSFVIEILSLGQSSAAAEAEKRMARHRVFISGSRRQVVLFAIAEIDLVKRRGGVASQDVIVIAEVRLEGNLAQRALAEDVAFERLSAYCTSDHPRTGIILGYGAIPPSKIDEGLRRLHRCFIATYSR